MTLPAHLGHIAAFALAFAAVSLTSLLGVRALGVSGHVKTVLAWGLLTCAQMVAAVEALSLLHAVNLPCLLALHVGVAAVLFALGARPARLSLAESARALWRTAEDPLLRVLVAAFVVAAALLLFLALYVPPNNHDSLTYHMTRVAAYLQQGSLDVYTTPDLRQTVFPANAEILILWQVVLLRHDTTAGLVQWASWAGCMTAIFGLARQLGFAGRSSLFAALAFGSFPAVVLQATSTQNDLTMAVFVLCAFFFGGAEPMGRRGGTLALAAIALGLAIGTKPLALLLVPGLACFVVASWAWRRRNRAQAARFALLCLFATALLGSYFYAQNLRRFGRATGPKALTDLVSLRHRDAHVVWSNLGRLGLRLLDPSGLVPSGIGAAPVLDRLRVRTQDFSFRHFGVSRLLPADDFMKVGWTDYPGLPIHEDLAAFGPLYGIVGLPVLAFAALRPRSPLGARALAVASCFYLLAIAALLRYQHTHSRLLVVMVAVGAPLLAVLYGARGSLRWAVNGVLVSIALATLATCVAYNSRKPLLGPAPVWRGLDRMQRMALGRPDLDTLLQVLDRLPPGALGVVPAGVEDFNYPLFREHLDQRIVFVHSGRLDPLRVESLPRVDYLLIWGERQAFLVDGEPLPTEWPWFDSRDLGPLLADLRRDGSPWRPVIEGGSLALYASRPVSVSYATAGLDHLPLEPPAWGDGWVPKRFRAPVRLDAARPALLVEGEVVHDGGRTVIEVAGPGGEILLRAEPPPGAFVIRVPLGSLLASRTAVFAPLEFRASTSFNPKRLGRWNDDRDLSWRLSGLRLEVEPAPP